jgi:hypothetical protein
MADTDHDNLKKQLQALKAKIQEHLNLTKERQDEAKKCKQELQEELEDEEDGGA